MDQESNLGALLGQLMSNPEIMEKVSTLLPAVAGMTAAPQGSTPDLPQQETVQASVNPRRDILYAIKPYLNGHRRDLVDKMLKAGDFVTLIKPRSK